MSFFHKYIILSTFPSMFIVNSNFSGERTFATGKKESIPNHFPEYTLDKRQPMLHLYKNSWLKNQNKVKYFKVCDRPFGRKSSSWLDDSGSWSHEYHWDNYCHVNHWNLFHYKAITLIGCNVCVMSVDRRYVPRREIPHCPIID